MSSYEEKKKKLSAYMEGCTKQDCMVAFSGGVDSSLVLRLACDAAAKSGRKVYGVTFQTRLHPSEDLAVAQKVAEEMGAEHRVIFLDELREADIADNPVDRCYRCKRYLFSELLKLAGKLSVTTVLEGTNGDDLLAYRPGIRAVRELGIRSPLAELGFDKAEVRNLAKELGISVAERPSAPCLATRFPYGAHLSYEIMERVEKGERWLRELGFYNVRLRVHGDVLRLEIDVPEFALLLQKREEIVERLKSLGFLYLTLDLEGFRSGSMDIGLRR